MNAARGARLRETPLDINTKCSLTCANVCRSLNSNGFKRYLSSARASIAKQYNFEPVTTAIFATVVMKPKFAHF